MNMLKNVVDAFSAHIVSRGGAGPANDANVSVSTRKKKLRDIAEAIKNHDVESLRQYAISPLGLINNSMRAKAWPLLLNINVLDIPDHTKLIQQHPDTDQVAKDIDRSLFKFYGDNIAQRDEKRKELSRVLNAVLSCHPTLKYYQGYHDVASILLLVTNERLAFAMLEVLSQYHIRDSLRDTLDYVQQELNLLFPLISLADKQVFTFLEESGELPLFALSWILTWFAHNIYDLPIMARLYDLFIASHPLLPLYTSAVVVISTKNHLLQVDCEYSAVHSFLSSSIYPLPMPTEELVLKTNELFKRYPPKAVQKKKSLPADSSSRLYPFYWMRRSIMETTVDTMRRIIRRIGLRKRSEFYFLALVLLGAPIVLLAVFVAKQKLL